MAEVTERPAGTDRDGRELVDFVPRFVVEDWRYLLGGAVLWLLIVRERRLRKKPERGSSAPVRRLPGEIAFDRCFLPLVAISMIGLVFMPFLAGGSDTGPRTEAQLAAEIPPPAWHDWGWFAAGMVLAVLLVRAVTSVLKTWNDPTFKVLRFSAAALLVPFAMVTWKLLSAPFV